MTQPVRGERRPPPRGDRRRSALLESLVHHLEDAGGSLESLSIGDVSRRAGVTRSAFYFYFENKSVAAATAAATTLYEEMQAVADHLAGNSPPRVRIEVTILELIAVWERHRALFRALLEARALSAEVRRDWEADRQVFLDPIVDMIEAERAAGRAPGEPAARTVADVLLGVNERTVERLAWDLVPDRAELVAAVVDVWLKTLYGRAPADPPPVPAAPPSTTGMDR